TNGMKKLKSVAVILGDPRKLDPLKPFSVFDEDDFYTIAIRSTVLPGTNQKVGDIIQNKSGKINGKDFAIVSNPEFLREGSAVEDFFNPPYTVLSSESRKGIDKMKSVYDFLNSDILVVPLGTAELIKFVSNSFHGLKIAFANEVGRICKSLKIDSKTLMELFVKDETLNISRHYLNPGFAYGGSCLPKDLKALNSIAHENYIQVPVLASIENSNQLHIEHTLKLLLSKNKKNIGFYGISFKAGTDDLRFSPALEIVERLMGKGYAVSVFDKNVNLSRLMGKNKEYLFGKLPHINSILKEDLNNFLKSIDILVIVNSDEFMDQLINFNLSNIIVIDLDGALKDNSIRDNYEGICW
ncbi:MAG: nucleotide sugar dehydrogenase, partial [Candidatus Lokiarchaeia archaeon]|nr:nucleotide sugar dehydrogenase [Candidatus Lokiarchaeia archaeon]